MVAPLEAVDTELPVEAANDFIGCTEVQEPIIEYILNIIASIGGTWIHFPTT